MVQLNWFKIKTLSFHPSPEWQCWSSHNLSLLEVTQEGRIQASSGLAGKKKNPDAYPVMCNYENTRCSSEGFSPGLLEQQVWLCRENRTWTYWKQEIYQVFYSCSSTNQIKYATIQFQEDSKRSKNPHTFLIKLFIQQASQMDFLWTQIGNYNCEHKKLTTAIRVSFVIHFNQLLDSLALGNKLS